MAVVAVWATPTIGCARMYYVETLEKRDKLTKDTKLPTKLPLNRSKDSKETRNSYTSKWKAAYCIRSSTRVSINVLYTTNCLLDAGVGRDLVAKSSLPASWMNKLTNGKNIHLCFAVKYPTSTLREADLFVIRGYSHTKATYNVVEIFAFNILIG